MTKKQTKEDKEMTTTVLTPTNDTVDLPVQLVVADPKKNTRSHLVGIEELAKSIEMEGQKTAVEVAPRGDGKYDLIAGFRRFAAISRTKKEGGLELDTIRATVYKEALNDKDRLLSNLLENMAREDLTHYDACKAFAQLRDLYPEGNKEHMSGGKIANRLAKSTSYVNNCLRCWDNLPETIKDRWKRECAPDWAEKANGVRKVCTPDVLNMLAKESMDDASRIEKWDELTGKKPVKPAGDGEGGNARPGGIVKRQGKRNLELALEAAEELKKKASGDRGQDQKVEKLNGVIAAIKFALGTNATIPGVFTPPVDDEEDDE